jgi:hypothetical protein
LIDLNGPPWVILHDVSRRASALENLAMACISRLEAQDFLLFYISPLPRAKDPFRMDVLTRPGYLLLFVG